MLGGLLLKSIAVFCGSRNGARDAYTRGAIALGKELVKRNITLVYGGSSIGLMGTIADTVLQEGGKVIGVMPRLLAERELAHRQLTELYIVETMHERKAKMAELSDGFIAMPGGAGTLEEFFEVFTWAQIGIHQKPIGLYNIDQYYEPLCTLFNHMAEEQFISEAHKSLAFVEEDTNKLLDHFASFQPI